MAVLYANVSPLHKPHCTTDRDDDREGGEVRERLVCSAMGQWKEGGREGGRGRAGGHSRTPIISMWQKPFSDVVERGREGGGIVCIFARTPPLNERQTQLCRTSKVISIPIINLM